MIKRMSHTSPRSQFFLVDTYPSARAASCPWRLITTNALLWLSWPHSHYVLSSFLFVQWYLGRVGPRLYYCCFRTKAPAAPWTFLPILHLFRGHSQCESKGRHRLGWVPAENRLTRISQVSRGVYLPRQQLANGCRNWCCYLVVIVNHHDWWQAMNKVPCYLCNSRTS